MAFPPVWFRDSLTYHLSLAKHYSNTGGYFPTDEVIFAYFPQGWQSILAFFHLYDRLATNPRYISVVLALACAAGIVSTAKESHKLVGYCGGALFLLIPTVIEFGSSCCVMVG